MSVGICTASGFSAHASTVELRGHGVNPSVDDSVDISAVSVECMSALSNGPSGVSASDPSSAQTIIKKMHI